MAPRKVVVFGVTGVQGGSVARSLLKEGKDKFEVWGVTRHKTSKKAQNMAQQGVTLIEGDLDNPSSYEQGLKGTYSVFINADFWQYYNGDNPDEAGAREEKQNRGAIDAAVRQGVKQIVFSCVGDFSKFFPLPHCDSKVRVAKYIKSLPNIQYSLVYPMWYFDNVLLFPKKREDNKIIVTFPFPDGLKMVGFGSEQYGEWAVAAFRDPEKWDKKSIQCLGECLTPEEMAKTLSEHLGVQVETAHLTVEQFKSEEFKKTLLHELWLNYLAIIQINLGGTEFTVDTTDSYKVNPNAWNFKRWCENTPAVKTEYGK